MLFYVLILAFLILIYFKLRSYNKFWIKRNIKSESELFWQFLTGNCSFPEIYKNIYDKYPNESHVGTFHCATPVLLIRDLENVQAILASDFHSFSGRGIVTNIRDRLADNLLFIDNHPRWKLIRQKLTPIFTGASLGKMFNVLDRCAYDFVSMMIDTQKMRETPFKALYMFTSASIGASFFGIDIRVSSKIESPFLDMAYKVLKPSRVDGLKFFIGNTSLTLLNLLNIKLFEKLEPFFVSTVKNLLKLRRQSKEKGSYDFIDLCIELQESGTMYDPASDYTIEPTDELLAAQAFLLFLAGADTSANTMHFTLLELSSNPDILFKVHEEIDRVFSECNEKICYGEIKKLTYLDQVIKEALRKYPPIGRLQRKCTNNTVLPVGNIKIEKGITIVIPTLAFHRDEKYFPAPEKFDPDRFSPKNKPKIKKYSYLPFGEGHRNCVGLRFARLLITVGLARLLRKFSLKIQNFAADTFEKNFISIRLANAHYELYKRENY